MSRVSPITPPAPAQHAVPKSAAVTPVNAAESCRIALDRLVRIGAICVAAIGASVVIGELFDIPTFSASLPSLSSMKVNTACAFLSAAAALWILHTCKPESMWFRVARGLGILVLAFGALSLAEDLFGIELGIDQQILADRAPAPHMVHPGRMSPGAAFDLVFVGLTLLTLKARRANLAACAHWLIVPALLVATLATIGYAYGVSALYAVKPYSAMAAHTAITFLVLGLSLLATDSAYGFAKIALSNTAGGIVSRRLLPTLPGVLFVLGWIPLEGQLLGLYDTRFGLALMVLLSITVCIVAVASTANTLHTVDLTRRRAEEEVLSLNAGLERRVQERTRELAQVSAQLSLVNTSLEKLSRQDALTGLANRRSFDMYLAEQIAIARRHKRTLALVLCDVDAFKAYNDQYGHQAGDECLKQVAAALQSCCRRTADMAARYGGEEFALILPETDLAAAVQIAEAVRAAVAQLRIAHAQSSAAPHVSISGGIAVLLRRADMSAEQLIADADQNLFQAKRLGRNRMIAVDPEKVLLAG
jgi:diguanylate cyclase (GGDEF)-like protein